MTLVPASTPVPVLAARPDPLDRLPGSREDDLFLRLLAGFIAGRSRSPHTAKAYHRDLTAWAQWCASLGVHPLAAERHHVDLWVRHLTHQPRPRTGRPAAPATVARHLSALSRFHKYGIEEAGVLDHSPVAFVERPRVSSESQAVGLTAEELKRLLEVAGRHSPRSLALVTLLVFCGLRISEALGADVKDYAHDQGHRVLKVMRKGQKAGKVPLPPAVVRTLDTYLEGRVDGPLFLVGTTRYSYQAAYDQLLRLSKTAELPPGVSPHSLRHSYATEALRLGALLQDVQDALGHADPRTTRRYDRSRNVLDRSPNYLVASSLTPDE